MENIPVIPFLIVYAAIRIRVAVFINKKYILSKNSEVYNDEEFSRIINLKDSISSIDNIKYFVFKETVFLSKLINLF